MTSEHAATIRLDELGVMRIGAAGILLDEIIGALSKGASIDAVQARFSSLTRNDVLAALDFLAAQSSDALPRGPQQRDAHWRRWNATIEEDLGTDTPPNKPTGEEIGP